MSMLKPAEENTWNRRSAAHLLNRAGFGGSPRDVDELHALGRRQAVALLLQAPDESGRFPEPGWMAPEAVAGQQRAAARMRRLRSDASLSPAEREQARREAQRQMRMEQRGMTEDSIDLWLRRMHGSPAQAREKMTLFWHGHFATSVQKVRSPVFMHRQNALFRRHALGNFRELTQAVCKDPAMMLYLDTDKNVKGRPNENFARELLELFTLGEGHYTEQDIREAARAFTGYQLNRPEGEARFLERRHDDGSKEFMGKTGRFKPEDIVDIVFEQPRCAEFMVAKIWEFLVAESPDGTVVEPLARRFRESGYEMKPLLEEILLSEAFYSPGVVRSQIKSPVQFVVQMARELELERVPARQANNAMQQLGQQLYNPPNVAGWEGGRSWINTNTLLTRYNIAGFLLKGGGGQKEGMRRPGQDEVAERRAGRGASGPVPIQRIVPLELRGDASALVAALTERLFHADLPEKDVERFREYALSKASKQFTDGEVAELLHLMMSTPHYQLA